MKGFECLSKPLNGRRIFFCSVLDAIPLERSWFG